MRTCLLFSRITGWKMTNLSQSIEAAALLLLYHSLYEKQLKEEDWSDRNSVRQQMRSLANKSYNQ